MRIVRTLFAGASRREDNHQAWEDADPAGAIKAKGRHAMEQGIRKQERKKSQSRRQRNNFREW